MVMGVPPHDLDLEIFGIAPDDFEILMKQLDAKGVGKSFFVYKWQGIDLSLPRTESKTGPGHRGFDVQLASDEKAAALRRDFTMNALMCDIYSGEILDFYGGLHHISNRRIHVIHPEKFQEDSLRVLRGMQFAARMGFKVGPKSLSIMRTIDLSDISQERIVWEFEKMLGGRFPHFGLFYFFSLGIAHQLLGLTISRQKFYQSTKELARFSPLFGSEQQKLFFLYVLAKNLGLPKTHIPEQLGFPKHYARNLQQQKNPPKRANERFLLALARKYPLQEWLGSVFDDYAPSAKRLGIYEQTYTGGITPAQLLAEGFSGKELGEELTQRQLKSIRQHHVPSFT